MISKIIGTIAVLATSLTVFMLADFSMEGIVDNLDVGDYPLIANALDFLSPVGIFYFIFPVMTSLIFWKQKEFLSEYGMLIWYFLIIASNVIIISLILTVQGYFLRLNGHREISTIRITGNILILTFLTVCLIKTFQKPAKNKIDE